MHLSGSSCMLVKAMDEALPTVFSVHQLTSYIKRLFDRDEVLQDVLVRGEVSNFRRHRSGHLYFTLKDEEAALDCVCFRNTAASIDFEIADGMAVVAGGRVSVYEKQGRYQLIVLFLRPDGVGALYAAFEQLKEKLEREGLFDESRKRPLPRFPKCIALVTSPTGAAVRDLTTIITRRYPLARILIIPTLVQGEQAPASIIRSLEIANSIEEVDLIIVGRGGGSIEDLWAFNDEAVARAIFASRKPTISAVGHERDFTIADFVADVRAATPSAAAEIAVPDKTELLQYLEGLASRAISAARTRVHQAEAAMGRVTERPPLRQPMSVVEQFVLRVDEAWERATAAMEAMLLDAGRRVALADARLRAHRPSQLLARRRERYAGVIGRLLLAASGLLRGKRSRVEMAWLRAEARHPGRLVVEKRRQLDAAFARAARALERVSERCRWRLARAMAQVEALNPKAVLERGYSITMLLPHEQVVRDARQVQEGNQLRILLARGRILAEAKVTEPEGNNQAMDADGRRRTGNSC